MDPRAHHFDFAKRVLAPLALRDTDRAFAELTGPRREAFLMFLWQQAGQGNPAPLPPADVMQDPAGGAPRVAKLEVVGAVASNNHQVVVVSMPPALAPNEALFVALVRGPTGPGVFFYERCLAEDLQSLSPREAMLAAMRADGSRSNYGAFPGLTLDAFARALEHVLGVSLAGLEHSLPPVTMAAFMGAPGGGASGSAARAGAGARGGAGGALETLLAVRAAWPPVLWVLGLALGRALAPMSMLLLGLRNLLSCVIGVVLLVWIYRVFEARRGQTRFSSGMAVGGWFIPVANAVLPALIVRDAWRAVVGPRGGAVVFAWWALWLLETAWQVLWAAGLQVATVRETDETHVWFAGSRMDLPEGLADALGAIAPYWGLTISVAAYGLLWYIVRSINRRL